MKSCSAPSKTVERKTVERNRRMHMKSLCFKLASLIPNNPKEALPQDLQLDQAANYITKLRERIEKMKEKKELAMRIEGINKDVSDGMMIGLRLPVIEIKDMGSTVEVILISGLNKKFMLYEVLSVLEEEGAEVINATVSTVGNKIFHTIHSQVTSSRVGFESERVSERLKGLIY